MAARFRRTLGVFYRAAVESTLALSHVQQPDSSPMQMVHWSTSYSFTSLSCLQLTNVDLNPCAYGNFNNKELTKTYQAGLDSVPRDLV